MELPEMLEMKGEALAVAKLGFAKGAEARSLEIQAAHLRAESEELQSAARRLHQMDQQES